MSNLVWFLGWVLLLSGIVVGAVALGMLGGHIAVLGYTAGWLVIAGGAVIAATAGARTRTEPS